MAKMTNEEIRHRYAADKATDSGTVDAMRRAREILAAAAVELNDLLPEGRELALVHTSLEQAKHWAVSALVTKPAR